MEPRRRPAEDPFEANIEDRRKGYLKALELFKRLDIENIVEDPAKKAEFIQNQTFEQFQSFLVRVNGILQNLPTSHRGLATEENAEHLGLIRSPEGHVTYVPPMNESKMELLKDAFEALKRMYAEGRVEEAGYMLGSSINAIHPAVDGNGRTARFMSMIVISSKDRMVAPQCNPDRIQTFIEQGQAQLVHKLKPSVMEDYDAYGASFPEGTPLEVRPKIVSAFEYDPYTIIDACRVFAKEQGDDFDSLFVSGPNRIFQVQKFLNHYKGKLESVYAGYLEYKKEYVRELINVFEEPQKHMIKDLAVYQNLNEQKKKYYENKTLLDLFKIENIKHVQVARTFSWDRMIELIKQDGR